MPEVSEHVSPARQSLAQTFTRVGRQGLVYGTGSIVQHLAAFVLLPLYTSALTTAEYGTLGLVLVTGQIAATIAALGLRPGLFRSYYDHAAEADRRTLIATVVYLTVGSSVLLCLLGIGSAAYLSEWILGTRAHALYFVLITLSAAGNCFGEIGFAVFRVRQQPAHFVVARLVVFLLRVGLVIYFVAVRGWGVFGVLLGYVLADAVSAAILLYQVREQVVLRFSWLEARKTLHFGAPLVLVGLFGFVSTYADRYILNALTSRSDVGLYTLAYQFGMLMVIVLITPVKLVWGPAFLSIKDQENFHQVCALALTYVMFLGGFLFLGIALLSEEVLQLIADPEFWAAYRIIPIIALTYLIWSARSLLEVGVQLARRTSAIAVLTLIGGGLNVGLNLLLIPGFGIMGAACATLISFSLVIIIDYLYNRRLVRIDYEWARIARVYLTVGVLLIGGSLLSPANVYLSAAVKLALIAAYPLLLLLLGFYRRGEIAQIKQLFQRIGVRGAGGSSTLLDNHDG
jgi:O-antigen/teichoic acid export membrane protein